MKHFFFLFCCLILPSALFGQGSQHNNFAWGLSGTNSVVLLPGATVTVCAGTMVPSPGTVCSPTTSIYTSSSLGSQATNPFTADAGSNFSFWGVNGSSYVISVSYPGFQAISYSWTAPLSGAIVVPSIDGILYVDGIVNTLPSVVNNAPSGTLIIVPPGTYNIGTPITITRNNVHVQCSGINATKINYTGGSVTAAVDVGTKDDGTADQYDDTINGCTIGGNSNTSYVLRTRGTHHSDFAHNSLINATVSAVYSSFAVTDNFSDLHTSSNEQAFSTTPANCIIGTGPDGAHAFSDNTLIGNICEGVSGDGWELGQASNTQIVGGTSEGNARGLNVTVNAVRTVSIGSDFEANSTEDVLVNGSITKFITVIMASTNGLHVGATATGVWLDTTTINGTKTYDVANQTFYITSPPSLSGQNSANVVWDEGVQSLDFKTLNSALCNSCGLVTPTLGGLTISNTPSMFFSSLQPAFTFTGLINTFTPTYNITITGLEYSVPASVLAGAGCSTAPVINVGGLTGSNLTMANGVTHAVETGLAITATAGNPVSAVIQTAASGCSTAWTNVTITMQYRMQ